MVAVALTLAAADRRGVIVLRAAVIAEMHLGGGIGVGEPAHGVAPAQQQGQLQGLIGGVAQLPAEHRHRIAGALVIPGKNGAERLADHSGAEHILVLGPAERVTGGVGPGSALGGAGRVPLPGAEGVLAIGASAVTIGRRGHGMGAHVLPLPFPESELAIRN